jgi:hypothetical protein
MGATVELKWQQKRKKRELLKSCSTTAEEREGGDRYCKAAAAIFQYSKYQKVIFFIVTLQPRNNTTHGRNSGEFAPT